MTAAQLRHITIKNDLHPDAPVYLAGGVGIVVGHRIRVIDGRKALVLLTDDSEPPEKFLNNMAEYAAKFGLTEKGKE